MIGNLDGGRLDRTYRDVPEYCEIVDRSWVVI